MSTLSEFQAAMQAADQAFSEVEEERRGLFRPDGGDRSSIHDGPQVTS